MSFCLFVYFLQSKERDFSRKLGVGFYLENGKLTIYNTACNIQPIDLNAY